MTRTTLTFRMPTLRLVGTLLILAVLAGLPTSAWAEFRIGVWQPGGHLASDVSFNHITVADLNSLGVDLLINTPSDVGRTDGSYQRFEENIMSQWNDAGKGFVVQHAPEGHSRFLPLPLLAEQGYHWKLERYAGSLCETDMSPTMSPTRRNNLGEAARLLSSKWEPYAGFYGYRIGHETDPCGHGIYDLDTYDNMSTVINSIRAYDTEHRIIAVGNTLDTRWTGHEQTAFLQNFFRPNTIPGGPDPSPANIFMQEVYILADGDVSEDDVQDEFDYLRNGLDSIGTMVDLALSDNRKAEWHFIVQVTRTNRDMTSTRPPQSGLYRHPTLPELKAQVNMALSRGAKGVTYFTYTSSNGYVGGPGGDQYEGLVDLNRHRNPIWHTVQTVNDTLRTLGDALYPLTWDEGFSFSTLNPLPNSTLVNAVRPSADHAATAGSLEFGVFHDDEADYVLVVNRHNLTITTGGSQTIDLRFDTQQMRSDNTGNGHYLVKEIITDVENIHEADDGHIWVMQQTLAPGDARLYRIERVEVPDAPQNPRATAGLSGIRLSWDAVEATPEVSGYRVRYQRLLAQPGSATWPSESSYVLQATVPHRGTSYTHFRDAAGYSLHPGHRYRYQVRVRNAVDYGEWSAPFPSNGAIVPAVSKPGLAGLVLDDESAGLVATWTCPNYGFCAPSSVWQIAPLRLTAEIKSGSSSSWSAVSATVSGEQTTHRVGGLSRRVVHQFRTRAVNLNGVAGRASEAIALVPLRTQTESGANWVALSWDQPDYAGLAWQYRYKTAASAMWGDWQEVSTSGTTPQTVSELTSGVSYQFQVRALSGTTARAVSFIESATAGTLPPETQSAYQISASGSNAPLFSATASGIPSGWSSSRQTPISTAPYEWQISRTRPAGGSWSNWGSATVVDTYPSPSETQSAYQISASGSNAPLFSATASGIPSGWSLSRQTPISTAPYEWRISRTRPAGGSWSNWGSATVVDTYPSPPETQFAYQISASGSNAPSFSATASGIPSGWSSSRQTPVSAAPYEWRIRRTRPSGGSWSNWGSATVVRTYPSPPETQSAYQISASGSNAPSFSATASGIPSGWSSSRQTPISTAPYEWRIRRTRPSGGSWSNWGSATVIRTYPSPPETQFAYQISASGSNAPSFSATASGIPSGWSSSRQTPISTAPYEWRIRRTRPSGGSWSNWGSATVVRTYPSPPETQSAYQISASGSNAPSFSATASGIPSGWSSSRQTPISTAPYEWRIRRTRPSGGSWSNWGSATVVRTYPSPPETQSAYQISASGSNAPSFSATASGIPSGWSSSRQTPVSAAPYEWRIRRTRPSGGSWSNWGSATVIRTYPSPPETQSAYQISASGSNAPSFSATASGIPSGWSSSRQTPVSAAPYEWRIRRTRPAGGSWSNWGSATVINTLTASMGIRFEPNTATRHIDVGETISYTFPFPTGAVGSTSYSYSLPSGATRFLHSFSWTAPDRGVSQYLRQLALPRRPQTARPPLHFVFSSMSLSTALPARYRDEPARNTA